VPLPSWAAGGACERIEGGPEVVVAVTNQKSGPRAGGRRVTKALRDPGLRREAGRRCENDLARGELDEHEREDRAEEHNAGRVDSATAREP
jgi:hypothetical protein